MLSRAESDNRLAPPMLTFELQVVHADGHALTEPFATEVATRTRIGHLLEPRLDW